MLVKEKVTKRISVYLVLLTLLYFELVAFDGLRFFGTRPELLLVATLFFGFHFGVIRGMEIGIISGVLKDIFSITAFGINAFSFLFIGFLAGFLKDKVFKDSFAVQLLLSNLSVYLISPIYFLYLRKIMSVSPGIEYWKLFIYKGLYTGFLAPFLFFVLARIFKQNLKPG